MALQVRLSSNFGTDTTRCLSRSLLFEHHDFECEGVEVGLVIVGKRNSCVGCDGTDAPIRPPLLRLAEIDTRGVIKPDYINMPRDPKVSCTGLSFLSASLIVP